MAHLDWLLAILASAIFLLCLLRIKPLQWDPDREAEQKARKWGLNREPGFWLWCTWYFAAFVAILALPWLLARVPANLYLLAALPSMPFVVWTVGRLSRAGLAHRTLVGSVVAQWVFWHTFMLIMLAQETLYLDRGVLHPRWTVICLFGAYIICQVVTLRSARLGRERFAAGIGLFIGILFLGGPLYAGLLEKSASPSDLAAWVAKQDPSPEWTPHWAELAGVTEQIGLSGGEEPDLERPRQRFHDAMERWMQGGPDEDPVNPYILAAAARMGFLTDREAEFLSETRRARGLVEPERALFHPGQLLAYVTALEMTGRLRPDVRESLARRLPFEWERQWELGRMDADDMLEICRLAEKVDAGPMLSDFQGNVHTLLRRMWIDPKNSEILGARHAGGFGAGFEPPEKSSGERYTWNAVELIARFGMPEGIDARALRLHLDGSNLPHGLFLRLFKTHVKREAALLRFASLEIPEAPLHPRDLIRSERLLLTALLLGLLCITVILRAPATSRKAPEQNEPLETP